METLSGPRWSSNRPESHRQQPEVAIPQNTEEIASQSTARRGRVRNPDFTPDRTNVYRCLQALFSDVPDLFRCVGERVG